MAPTPASSSGLASLVLADNSGLKFSMPASNSGLPVPVATSASGVLPPGFALAPVTEFDRRSRDELYLTSHKANLMT